MCTSRWLQRAARVVWRVCCLPRPLVHHTATTARQAYVHIFPNARTERIASVLVSRFVEKARYGRRISTDTKAQGYMGSERASERASGDSGWAVHVFDGCGEYRGCGAVHRKQKSLVISP